MRSNINNKNAIGLENEEFSNEEFSNEDIDLLEQINISRIKELTKQKIHNEEKHIHPTLHKNLLKAASIVISILCISSASVYAASNTEIRQSISEMLGISQTEILTVGDSVNGKDYKLSVLEITSDSHIGWVTISVEAISDKAKETFHSDNLLRKFSSIGSMGHSARELEELREASVKYYSYSFTAYQDYHYKDGLTFQMDGIKNKIKIPIPQTIPLHEKVIYALATEIHSVTYDKMEYSELGFMLYGTTENVDVSDQNQDIIIELLDGTIIDFYHGYQPLSIEKQDNINTDTNIDDDNANNITSQTDSNGYVSSSNSTSYEDHNTSVSEIDEEWYSGSGIGGNDGTGNITNIFQFSKKMDWTKVKSITINDTVIPMQ